jgi:hypothetical protein
VTICQGTRDYGPAEMFCREHIEKTVKDVFHLYGGSCLDTPVFERKDILAGKYGEDAKLIFDLKDQGGRGACSPIRSHRPAGPLPRHGRDYYHQRQTVAGRKGIQKG